MYLQVQVPIPIHESTPQSAIISCHYYLNWCLEIHLKCTNNRIGTCTTYLTNSDTIKDGGIGPIPIQIPELVQP